MVGNWTKGKVEVSDICHNIPLLKPLPDAFFFLMKFLANQRTANYTTNVERKKLWYSSRHCVNYGDNTSFCLFYILVPKYIFFLFGNSMRWKLCFCIKRIEIIFSQILKSFSSGAIPYHPKHQPSSLFVQIQQTKLIFSYPSPENRIWQFMSGSSRPSALTTDIPGDLVWDLPCMQQASYLKGGPLVNVAPVSDVNQKSNYDYDMIWWKSLLEAIYKKCQNFLGKLFLNAICENFYPAC